MKDGETRGREKKGPGHWKLQTVCHYTDKSYQYHGEFESQIESLSSLF